LNPALTGLFLLCALLRLALLCLLHGLCCAWLCRIGAQALPGSVRVRFGLKKGLNMRGYSGSMGASTNVGRSEHISAFKCVQSVCLSGSAYAKNGFRPPELRRSLPFCIPFWVHFGVFEGRNGRYPPHKKNEGHFSFQGKTTFSVATLQI